MLSAFVHAFVLFMHELTRLQHERASIQAEINTTSTDTLQPPLDESSLLQELVAQFLAHDGYVETAHAFAQEVATETAALQSGHGAPLKKYEVEEDHHAVHRNSKYFLFSPVPLPIPIHILTHPQKSAPQS